MDELTTVGERIAYYRRRRGLTQEVLAGLVGRSTVWLSKIERGERTLDKVSVLLALARVLKVSPGDLIGGIDLPPDGGDPLDPPRGIHAIRRATLLGRSADREPPTVDWLRAEVEQSYRLRQAGDLEALAVALPELLSANRAAAAHEVPGTDWWVALTYRLTSGLVRAFGEVELAWLAAERAVDAAQRSGDARLVALCQRLLANAALREGWLDEAGAVCSDAADAIAPTDATPLEGWSVWGSLHLTEAVAAIRSGDAAAAWRLLGDARTAAERVGPGRNDYWDSFGPANVGTIEVTVALEAGDPVEVLRIADEVEVEELPSVGRRAKFCIALAHAHSLRRDDAATVGLLLEAERHAPQEVRYSVKARELVRVCLGRERRSRTPGLRGLAERLGQARV